MTIDYKPVATECTVRIRYSFEEQSYRFQRSSFGIDLVASQAKKPFIPAFFIS
jgi:hypothetical protein